MSDGGGQILPEQRIEQKDGADDDQGQTGGAAGYFQHKQNGGRAEKEIRARHLIHIADAFQQIVQFKHEVEGGGHGDGAADEIQRQQIPRFGLLPVPGGNGDEQEHQHHDDGEVYAAQQGGINDEKAAREQDLEQGEADADGVCQRLQP